MAPSRYLSSTFLVAIGLFGLIGSASFATGDEAKPGKSIKTEHYDLYTEDGDPEELGRLVEALHTQLKAFFDAEPKGDLLRVELYSNRDHFAAALRADHQPRISAGGYYSPATRKAYLWRQPSDYFTQHLLLHECTHQFHYLVATKNRNPKAEWYTEGLAEYFGMHNWDGKTLRVGVIPAISLEDYPAIAGKHYQDVLHRDFAGLATGATHCDRPEAWALVRFLIEREPEVFKALSLRLNIGVAGPEAWAAAAGKHTEALGREFDEYLKSLNQPWSVATVAWEGKGDRLEGESDTTAMALLKSSPKSCSIDVAPVEGKTWPGVVVNYHSIEDYAAVQLLTDGSVRFTRRKDGNWIDTQILPPHAAGRNTISFEKSGEKWLIKVNGELAITRPADGQIGLYVQEGKASFGVTTKP